MTNVKKLVILRTIQNKILYKINLYGYAIFPKCIMFVLQLKVN